MTEARFTVSPLDLRNTSWGYPDSCPHAMTISFCKIPSSFLPLPSSFLILPPPPPKETPFQLLCCGSDMDASQKVTLLFFSLYNLICINNKPLFNFPFPQHWAFKNMSIFLYVLTSSYNGVLSCASQPTLHPFSSDWYLAACYYRQAWVQCSNWWTQGGFYRIKDKSTCFGSLSIQRSGFLYTSIVLPNGYASQFFLQEHHYEQHLISHSPLHFARVNFKSIILKVNH